jgi:hypothetical protein
MFSWLASKPWAYAALALLQIVGSAWRLGNLLPLELRLWGGGATLPLPALARMAAWAVPEIKAGVLRRPERYSAQLRPRSLAWPPTAGRVTA